MVERTAHNGPAIGSSPIRPNKHTFLAQWKSSCLLSKRLMVQLHQNVYEMEKMKKGKLTNVNDFEQIIRKTAIRGVGGHRIVKEKATHIMNNMKFV